MKKGKIALTTIIIAVLCAVLSFSVFAASGVKAECILGDADADGYITVADARLVLRVAVGITSIPKDSVPMFDLDGDNTAGVGDARLVLRTALSLEKAPTHKVIEDKEIPATCMETGLSAGQHCTICGRTIREKTTLPTSGHKYEDKVTAPTCAKGGYTVHTCIYGCGTTYTDSETATLPHTWNEGYILKAATCTEEGLQVLACTVCDSGQQEIIPAKGHTLVTDEALAPTCTEKGLTEGVHCENCDLVVTEQEEIAPTGHTEVITPGKDPTCSKPGYSRGVTCSVCNEVLEEVYFLKTTEHTSVYDEPVSPTCTKTGLTGGYHCGVCGAAISSQKVLPAKGHTMKTTAEKAATCETAGNSEYYTCTVCGRCFTDTDGRNPSTVDECTIPATGHDYQETATKNPTCTTDGSIQYICKNDNSHTKTEAIPATGHTEKEIAALDPTCLEAGHTAYTVCSVCNEKLTQPAVILALGHDMNEGRVTQIPTCTTPGYKLFTCRRCGDTENSFLKALGHSYNDTVTPVTCLADGFTFRECTVCGDKVTTDIIPATGHNPAYIQLDGGMHQKVCLNNCGETYTQPEKCEFTEKQLSPTCTQQGGRQYVCNYCERTIAVYDTPANGHTKGKAKTENYVAVTCTEDGGFDTVYYCTVCDAEVSRQHTVIEKIGHKEASPVSENNIAPTCEGEGSYDKVIYCSKCNAELSRENITIPATGHTPVKDAAIEPTCTEDGRTEGSHCKNCRKVLTPTTPIPATGHTAVKVEGMAPTCTLPGLTDGKKCSKCGKTIELQSVIARLGHDKVTVLGKAATCTEAGSTTYEYCKRCNRTLTASETIPAKGHTAVTDAAVTKTCTTDGKTEGSHCTTCGAVLKAQTVLKAEGHKPTFENDGNGNHRQYCTVCNETLIALTKCSFEDTVTAPTCTEGGFTKHECTVCGYSYTDEITEATGHTPVTDEAVAPTCTEVGLTAGSHCATCKEVLEAQSEIPATGHTEKTETKPDATCTEDGATDYIYCEICGTVIQESAVIPAKGHSPVYVSANNGTHDYKCKVCGEVLIAGESCTFENKVTEPTCTETGFTGMTCTACGYRTTGDETPAKGHTPANAVKENEVKPTCTTAGSYDSVVYCTVCIEKLSTTPVTVPADGHKAGTAVKENEVAPDCTTVGSYNAVIYCTVCKEKLSSTPMTIPAKGHTPVTDKGVAPTCTETGLSDGSHCKVCGVTVKEKEILPANGHTMGEWSHYYDENGHRSHERKCTVCGITESGVCRIEMLTDKNGNITFACPECGYTAAGESTEAGKNNTIPYLRKEED